MRLCLVGDVQSIHIQRFASYLAYSNEVHLLTHTAGSCNDTVVHDIGPYLPPTRIDYNTIRQLLRTVGRVKKAIKEVRPDIVHGHYLQDAAFFAARSGYHPLVVSAWGSDVLIHPFRSRAYRLMTKYVLKRADRIHSVSRHLTEKLIELGAKKEKILTVP
ncbi:MAG: glycosyltransferase, partial [Thermoplasmata archaeon]